uniref:Zinc finger PHD-type domain-containing protein n=1 Tax=Oryza brachyantha TaxID=4533 RepID=J3NBL3_ORYBR
MVLTNFYFGIMQTTVCEVCGVIGCRNLLLSCKNCNGAAVHRYCLEKADFDGMVVDWSCDECHPACSKVPDARSLEVSQDDKTVVGRLSEINEAASSLDTNHDEPRAHGGSGELTLERNKEILQFHVNANNDFRQRSMSANVAQPSPPHEESLAQTISASANTDVLPKDSNCAPSTHTQIGNIGGSSVGLVLTGGKENRSEPSTQLDEAYSGSLSKDSSGEKIVHQASSSQVELPDAAKNFCKDNPRKRRKLILVDDDDDDDDVEVELSNTVQNVKDNRRKRRKLILPDDDDDDVEVELSNTVQNIVMDNPRKPRQLILLDDDVQEDAKNMNPLSLQCEGPIKKHIIDSVYAKESRCLEDDEHDVLLDSLAPQTLENSCPTKKWRRYICTSEYEEEEAIKGSMIADCALNDVENMASQPVDAKDHLQSRMTLASDFTKHQYYIYSQPVGEPVWSGIFMTDSNVSVMLAAHLSTKACPRVFEFARSLQQVIEVIKLPRLKAWPKSWGTSGPTDDSIGLFFFPRSMRPNEELDRLLKEVIESDLVLKAVLGTVELLVFPSILLPEQYHEFQRKYYLWGVCRARKDDPDTAVLVEEQGGLASMSEGGEVQEHHILDHQYEAQCESPKEECFAVKRVEDQLAADRNHEAQKGDTKTALRENSVSPDSCLSSNNPSPPKAGSHYFMQPRGGNKPSEPDVADQQEEQDFTSLPRWNNDRNATNPPSDPPANRLFGFVTAQSARCHQLIQEMIKEGALLFSVPEEMTSAGSGSTTGKSNGVGAAQAPDSGCQHIQELHKPIEFVPIDQDDADTDAASEACLELFPVRQEQIGSTPGVDVQVVELDLSLGASRRPPSALSR